jgi:Protein of unknown function (DUF3891)
MLFREDGEAAVAIAQPSHAWLSGQLARAWGNERFAVPSPREEVCLGAEQHDIGWLEWEAAPTLNPQTGRPHAFMEVGAATHIGLWTRGVRLALAYGHYPALLVSLHAKTIYETYYDFAKAAPAEAARVRAFLAEQDSLRRDLLAALAGEKRDAADVAPETVERNRLLVAATDRMSLEICWGVRGEKRVPDVPATGGGRTELRLRAPAGDPASLELDPWPFAADRVAVLCEGRRLAGRFADEAAMRRALSSAPPAAIAATLRPR